MMEKRSSVYRDEANVIRQVAYVTFGILLGIFTNLFSFWAGLVADQPQEVLPVKMATRGISVGFQSTIFSVATVVLLGIVVALGIGAFAKKKLT